VLLDHGEEIDQELAFFVPEALRELGVARDLRTLLFDDADADVRVGEARLAVGSYAARCTRWLVAGGVWSLRNRRPSSQARA
jgi:hypothetical protein